MKSKFIILGIVVILVIGIITLFVFTQMINLPFFSQETDLRKKCCQECINTYLKFGQHIATAPGCVPSKMSGECIIYLNLQNYFVPPFDEGDDSISAYNSCHQKEITQDSALKLANLAVSDYGIIFDVITKESFGGRPKFAIQFIEECDFSGYTYNKVWVAEKDIGEKEIGGKKDNVIVYVYVGLDGRTCAEAKLENVIPGIIPIERVFDQ